MIDYVIPLIALALLGCGTGLRLGVWISLAMGFVMDPVRKVYPDQPVWMSGVAAACITVTFIGAWVRGETAPLDGLRERYRPLLLPLVAGLAWVAIESARGFLLTGSLAVAAIGVLAYAVPVMAFLLGFACLDRPGDLERLTKVHVGAASLMLGATLLGKTGVGSDWLAQVGTGLHIHAYGRTVASSAGLFRGLEMAGWHAAAGLALVAVLGLAARRRPPVWFLAIAVSLLGYGLVLAARRKYMIQFVVFLALWGALGWLYRRTRQAGAWGALLVLVLAAIIGTMQVGVARADRVSQNAAVRRIERLDDDTGSRVQYFAFRALGDVYERNGFFGSGAGTGSQGAQYFGAGMKLVTGFQAEGGFGKVLAELGVPGLVLMAWLAFAAVRCLLTAISETHVGETGTTDMATGVAAFLLSNVAVFAVAHQVFGDPLVLTVLGLLAGGLLRLPSVRSDEDDALDTREGVGAVNGPAG